MDILTELNEIRDSIKRIESLLQRLPEIQAAVFLQMQEEYRKENDPLHTRHKQPKDLWDWPPPAQR